jgi:hypothetical protein
VKRFTALADVQVQDGRMFTHAATFQTVRLSILLVALLALAAFAVVTSLPRLQMTASSPAPAAQRIALTPAPIQTETSACGRGAYVTGDMAGDASPSSVYAALCGAR